MKEELFLSITITSANSSHTSDILRLLSQICRFHSSGRPDIFKADGQKYSALDLELMYMDADSPIFVAEDENGTVLGYAFCKIFHNEGSSVLTANKRLYLDDLCVDEQHRGGGIGHMLMEHVISYGREIGCYNLDLNVWSFNENAQRFYESFGMKPSHVYLEMLL